MKLDPQTNQVVATIAIADNDVATLPVVSARYLWDGDDAMRLHFRPLLAMPSLTTLRISWFSKK